VKGRRERRVKRTQKIAEEESMEEQKKGGVIGYERRKSQGSNRVMIISRAEFLPRPGS
jgi:hypothetical protein